MHVDYKLEVIVLPVSDVDRAKEFYAERCGFNVDVDTGLRNDKRIVQLTPPGSACSVTIGQGLIDSAPGSVKGLQLVVSDVEGAREDLAGRGVEVSTVQHLSDDGRWEQGKGGPWNSFVFFTDPDGNAWTVQERPAGAG
jgi:catechol 2,3-dioxygenase-like lactoylglutathione lyase family enzyme